MPIQFGNSTKKLPIKYNNNEGEIEYDPDALTVEAIESLSISVTEKSMDEAVKLLTGTPDIPSADPSIAGTPGRAPVLRGWDVLDANGQPMPITPETFKKIPIGFVTAVVSAIVRDIQPGEELSANSGGSFSPTGS